MRDLLELSPGVGGHVAAAHQLPDDKADVYEAAAVTPGHSGYNIPNEIAKSARGSIFLQRLTHLAII